MQLSSRLNLALLLATLISGLTFAFGASAHSMKEVDKRLWDREKYFQPFNKPAPAFSLQDADGRKVRLSDFRGKVTVLHFIFASCPDACPLHSDLIARIQERVNRSPMKGQVQFISITTDPQKDTPKVLRVYGTAHGLDPANWVFLTPGKAGTEDATRQLVEKFGHKFIVDKDGNQVHSVVTHVIDTRGRWRANFHGLNFKPANLVLYIEALVNNHQKPHPPKKKRNFWDKVKGLF